MLLWKPPLEHVKEIINAIGVDLRPAGWQPGNSEALEVWNAAQPISLTDTEANAIVSVYTAGEERANEGISLEIPPDALVIGIIFNGSNPEWNENAFDLILKALQKDERRLRPPEFDEWEYNEDESSYIRSITAYVIP